MAKMFALTSILMPDNTMVERRTVFTCTPAQAKQFDKLRSARPATPAEIEAADRAEAEANGTAFLREAAVEATKPASGAPGDPQGAPKGKSA